MMRKTNTPSELDRPPGYVRHSMRNGRIVSRRAGNNLSIGDLARISTAARKVKITLPRMSCLEQAEGE